MNFYIGLENASRKLYIASRPIDVATDEQEAIAAKLDELLETESPETAQIRGFAITTFANLKQWSVIGGTLAVGTIVLAVFLPTIPTITLAVVATVALPVFIVFFGIAELNLTFASDYEKVKLFYKDVVLSMKNENDIRSIAPKCVLKHIFKVNPPHRGI